MGKISKELVGKIARNACRVVLYGAALILPCLSAKDAINMRYYVGDIKYSDTIGVIMNSRMFSSDKTKAIEVLKKDGDTDFYKAIIQVVNSNMFSCDKLKAITDMCKEAEEA